MPSDSASASVSAVSTHRCAERFCIGLDVGKHSVVRHCECGQNLLCSDVHVQTGQRAWPAITTALSLPISNGRSDSKHARSTASTSIPSTSISSALMMNRMGFHEKYSHPCLIATIPRHYPQEFFASIQEMRNIVRLNRSASCLVDRCPNHSSGDLLKKKFKSSSIPFKISHLSVERGVAAHWKGLSVLRCRLQEYEDNTHVEFERMTIQMRTESIRM